MGEAKVGGWELEACGAGDPEGQAWLYPSGDGAVKLTCVDEDGRARMRVFPNAVLAHVLRVQGYMVELDMGAAAE
jgi:hypothetical protein